MPRLGEYCLNQAIWLLYLDVKRRDVTQWYKVAMWARWPDCRTDTTRLMRFLTQLNITVNFWLQGDLTSIQTSPHFWIGSSQPLAQPGAHLAHTGMWTHKFMQHSNKIKNSGAFLLFPIYSGFWMFQLHFRRMLGANTARKRLKEGDLKSRRPKKATFLTARHKQERFRFAYNFNVFD